MGTIRFVLTPVSGALVKFVMSPKLSLWGRSVPPAVLPLLAMMAAIPLVCGLTLSGFGPIWHAATMMAALHLVCGFALFGLGPFWFAATLLTLMGYEALFERGLALAREEVVGVTGDVSAVDARTEIVYEDASFGAAAPVALDDEIVGVVSVSSAGVFVPDLKGNSSRACACLSADPVCTPVGSIGMSHSGMWNLPAVISCAFSFQSLLAAMLAVCFYVPGLLFSKV